MAGGKREFADQRGPGLGGLNSLGAAYTFSARWATIRHLLMDANSQAGRHEPRKLHSGVADRADAKSYADATSTRHPDLGTIGYGAAKRLELSYPRIPTWGPGGLLFPTVSG